MLWVSSRCIQVCCPPPHLGSADRNILLVPAYLPIPVTRLQWKTKFFHSVVCHCCLFIVVPGEKFFFSESGSELIPPLTRFYGFRLWGHQPRFSASVSSCAGFLMVCWALKVEKRRPGLSADLSACDGVSLLLSVCCHSILSIYHLSSVFVSWCLFQLLAEDLGKVIPGLMIVALWIWF